MGKKQPVRKGEKIASIPVEELIGDGNATVTQGKTIKRGIPFGEASISCFSNVSITCNQDRKTILNAGRTARKLADKLLLENTPDVEDFINDALQKAIKNRGKV